ncbi:hypothetical protein ACIRSU_22735 [Streptomyces sp. NPDC101160]|uniref:hypothetical protein n=1 Tax=Streptomyces sp. NPDC101160 TaxID=3366118 RepID=UPI00380973EB
MGAGGGCGLGDGAGGAVYAWPAPGAAAWRKALGPLTAEQRRLFVDTLLAYEAAVTGEDAD